MPPSYFAITSTPYRSGGLPNTRLSEISSVSHGEIPFTIFMTSIYRNAEDDVRDQSVDGLTADNGEEVAMSVRATHSAGRGRCHSRWLGDRENVYISPSMRQRHDNRDAGLGKQKKKDRPRHDCAEHADRVSTPSRISPGRRRKALGPNQLGRSCQVPPPRLPSFPRDAVLYMQGPF